MKVKELRIENQIYVNGVVRKLSATDILTLSQSEIFGVEMPYCNPIKLTEDMLLKCGFRFEYEKVLDRVYANNDFMLYWNKQNGYRLFYHDKCLSIGITYWHQLQNLYMDVMGNDIFL